MIQLSLYAYQYKCFRVELSHAFVHAEAITPHEDALRQQRYSVIWAAGAPQDSATVEAEAWQNNPFGSFSGLPADCGLEQFLSGLSQKQMHACDMQCVISLLELVHQCS